MFYSLTQRHQLSEYRVRHEVLLILFGKERNSQLSAIITYLYFSECFHIRSRKICKRRAIETLKTLRSCRLNKRNASLILICEVVQSCKGSAAKRQLASLAR